MISYIVVSDNADNEDDADRSLTNGSQDEAETGTAREEVSYVVRVHDRTNLWFNGRLKEHGDDEDGWRCVHGLIRDYGRRVEANMARIEPGGLEARRAAVRDNNTEAQSHASIS